MKSRKETARVASQSSASSSGDQDSPTRPIVEEIRLRAYELYVERGRVEGQDREHWLQAEKELTEIIRKRKSG